MSSVLFGLSFLISWHYLVHSLPLQPRMSLVEEWHSYYTPDLNGPGTYTFGYDLEDPQSGNVQYRVEERYANGTVIGSYGLLEPDGNVKVVEYIADHLGYRAKVTGTQQRYPRYHPPRTSIIEQYPSSIDSQAQRLNAIQPMETIGQNIQEQRKPPKHQRSSGTENVYKTWPRFNNF